jgi:hypothetical protein
MSLNFNIQPECEADTVMIEVLGFKKTGHQQGVNNVINAFAIRQGLFMVGIIDRDKRQPSKMLEFEEVKRFEALVLLRHKVQRQHYLISHPNLEDWLYEKEAKTNNVEPAQYGFKSKSYFHEVAKSKDALKNNDLRSFFNALKQKSPTLQTLQSWLEELVI